MADDDRTEVAHEVLARLSDTWSVRVARQIEEAPLRFSEIKRKISVTSPISARGLTRTLKLLECDGFITRQIFPVIPPKVEYRITALGRRFLTLSDRIADWTMINGPDLEAARQASALILASTSRPLPHSLPVIA